MGLGIAMRVTEAEKLFDVALIKSGRLAQLTSSGFVKHFAFADQSPRKSPFAGRWSAPEADQVALHPPRIDCKQHRVNCHLRPCVAPHWCHPGSDQGTGRRAEVLNWFQAAGN